LPSNDANTKGVLRLQPADLVELIASSQLPIVADISADWCFPCQMLRPILRKLAIEFADRILMVEIDGDGHAGLPYAVEALPTLLLFKNGQLVRTERGFTGLYRTYELFGDFLGVSFDQSCSAAESSFRQAHCNALASIDSIMEPPSAALAPYLAAIDAEWKTCQARIATEAAAGRLSEHEAPQLRQVEWQRLSASFNHQIEALRQSQDQAVATYRQLMAAAVDAFAAATALQALSHH
jgi:thioredoxin 1